MTQALGLVLSCLTFSFLVLSESSQGRNPSLPAGFSQSIQVSTERIRQDRIGETKLLTVKCRGSGRRS